MQYRRFPWLILLAVLPLAASAADLEVSISDTAGKPVQDAVVSLEPMDSTPPKPVPHATAVMDQRDREFMPHVLAVQAGTAVSFPNSDNIHHDVYSFSPAKVFELPLYKGIPSQPVVFDKPGVVVLGCNIHDWMLGYIDVVPTPWFVKSDAAGQAELTGVPPGKYHLVLWHPDLDAVDNRRSEDVVLDGKAVLTRKFTLTLKPSLHKGNKPADSLQSKFNRFGDDKKPPPLPN
jgi:plastocyanin